MLIRKISTFFREINHSQRFPRTKIQISPPPQWQPLLHLSHLQGILVFASTNGPGNTDFFFGILDYVGDGKTTQL